MRAAAAAALLQFLLDYPLGSGRLRGHVRFLLANTSYEHEAGRLQALEMLQQVRAAVWRDHRAVMGGGAAGWAAAMAMGGLGPLLASHSACSSCLRRTPLP